jgi:hypothetical protein
MQYVDLVEWRVEKNKSTIGVNSIDFWRMKTLWG